MTDTLSLSLAKASGAKATLLPLKGAVASKSG